MLWFLIPSARQADSLLARGHKPGQPLSMEAASITGWRTTLRYAPSIVASFTIGRTFNWTRCTPVRQPIQPNLQPESFFGFKSVAGVLPIANPRAEYRATAWRY